MSEKLENLVRDLWIAIKEEGREVGDKELSPDDLEELEKAGYVRREGGRIVLTNEGERVGRKLVRLHRLTERLLSDVLGMEEEVYERVACRVEHLIPEELEEAVCTLLGHPRLCPHGKPIPPGGCCLSGKRYVETVVHPLTELEEGGSGRISYIYVENPQVMTRLMNLGLRPGRRVTVLKRFPAYIVQVGNTQVALDYEVASRIYVVSGPHH